MNGQQSKPDHEAIDLLLPWYVNGTLNETERGQVERHLEACEECRENLDFLGRVEQVARHQEPLPLVPQPDEERLLERLAPNEAGIGRSGSLRLSMAAAAVMVMVLAVTTLFVGLSHDTEPSRFETVISPSAETTMQYVVELRLTDGTSESQVDELLATIGDHTVLESIDDQTIRVHVQYGRFSDLQERIDSLRALPRVAAAEVVAVHVPVE